MLPLAVRPRQWSRKHFLIVLETASHLIGLDERLWACLPQHPDRDAKSVSSRADQLLVAPGPQWTVLLLLLHGPSPPPRNREYPYFPTATAAKLSQTFFSTPTEAGSLTADMSFVQDHL